MASLFSFYKEFRYVYKKGYRGKSRSDLLTVMKNQGRQVGLDLERVGSLAESDLVVGKNALCWCETIFCWACRKMSVQAERGQTVDLLKYRLVFFLYFRLIA